MEEGDEGVQGVPTILAVGAENAGEAFGAVEGNPRELPAVVVQKAGRETDTAACRHVGQRGIVIGTVEIGSSILSVL